MIDAHAHEVEGFQQQLQAQETHSQQQAKPVEQPVHQLDLKKRELVLQLYKQKQRLEQELHIHMREKELLQRQLQDQQQLIRSTHQQLPPHPHPLIGHPFNPELNLQEMMKKEGEDNEVCVCICMQFVVSRRNREKG